MKQGESHICTFRVGHMRFGLKIEFVQEVLRADRLTRIPLTPPVVAGLLNLRGQILTTVDLRRLLGLEDAAEDMRRLHMVLADGQSAVSFLIDSVGEVLTVDPSNFEDAPENLKGIAHEIILGSFDSDGQLVLLFDARRVLELVAHEVEQLQRTHILGR